METVGAVGAVGADKRSDSQPEEGCVEKLIANYGGKNKKSAPVEIAAAATIPDRTPVVDDDEFRSVRRPKKNKPSSMNLVDEPSSMPDGIPTVVDDTKVPKIKRKKYNLIITDEPASIVTSPKKTDQPDDTEPIFFKIKVKKDKKQTTNSV